METKRWVLYYSTVCDGLNMMEATPEIMREHPDKRYWVLTQDFDRVTAERDSLQLRLNAVEEENDRLRSALKLVVDEEAPSYHDCTDNGLQECAWCIAKNELEKRP